MIKFFSQKELWYTIRRKVLGSQCRCLNCGIELFDDHLTGLCSFCREELIHTYNHRICERCGTILSPNSINDYCGNCTKNTLYFDYIRSAVVTDEISTRYVLRLKEGQEYDYADMMGAEIFYAMQQYKINGDVVVFVPDFDKKRGLHTKRIAREFCRLSGLPMSDALVKTRKTLPQKFGCHNERIQNVHNAFSVTDKEDIKDKKVIIIDDIRTSGATINECAKVLKKNGAAMVIGLTFAGASERIQFENSIEPNSQIIN